MRTGHLSISHESNTPTIEVRLINGTVWLTKPQISDLFGTFVQTIDGCLKVGFRSGTLIEANVCRIHRYTDEKQQERQTVFYNLEALIFISYHVNSANIAIFRQWITQILREHVQRKEITDAFELSHLLTGKTGLLS